ncbi:unnamed protein product [Cunninghamella blakesleeana]
MYDSNLKYIAISYRWGELNEQQVETPDYTAHITSFHLEDLYLLCSIIYAGSELCDIPYLWIDAISVDQLNKEGKKKTILKMNQIYQKATYILAVPDLHKEYLLKNTANMKSMNLIEKYKETIYEEIIDIKHLLTDSINDQIINSTTDSIKSSIINPMQQQQQQYTNKDAQYSFIQKFTCKKLIKKNKKLERENEELKIENKKTKTKMKEMEMGIKENKLNQEKNELKAAYQFLSYLLDDYSNRAWVISEYHIAKDKYIQHGTPLKYIFISLLDTSLDAQPFFSYYFDDDKRNNILTYKYVIDLKTFHQFVKERLMQRSHLEMMLNSNATRNEDRFNAILPSWNKYKHFIKNVSKWNISSMTSVRLKLYEILDNDLWEKAKLLNASSLDPIDSHEIIFPTFANDCNVNKLKIVEKMSYDDVAYKEFETSTLEYISNYIDEENTARIKQLVNEYHINSKEIWIANLASIQFEQYNCCLFVKSNSYFIKNEVYYEDEVEHWKYRLSLDDDDEIHSVFLPFFTFAAPDCADDPRIYLYSSSIHLVGSTDKNKWILVYGKSYQYKSEHLCSNDYTFNIY